jgi:hypothetical protein
MPTTIRQVIAGTTSAVRCTDGRSAERRAVKRILAGFVDRLGDAASDPTVFESLKRVAELEVLAAQLRQRALRHEQIDLLALNRLEGVVRRQRRALNLDGLPPEPAPAPPSYAEHLRQREAAS